MSEVVTGVLKLGGWWGMEWQVKIRVHNGFKAEVKPKN